jgi:aminopeptidase-like protein
VAETEGMAMAAGIERDLRAHVEVLFPICRSITGPGLRETLRYIARHVPLELREVPTGTSVLDWEVPREWTPRGATIRTMDGRTIVDFADHNLHLLQYSVPVAERVVPRAELDKHLHSLPDQPDLIPYRTAYYADTWGFCLAHRDRVAMADPEYRVAVDTRLAPGSLTYGECVLPGRKSERDSGHDCGREPAAEAAGEFLFSIHCCHPSLANDNLASIAVAIELVRLLMRRPDRRLTYRFVFVPGTIGAITWLATNPDAAARVRHGLVLSCLGDAAPPTYKQSRRGDALIDRYVRHVLQQDGHGERVLPFVPYGYDERQYCSPGFNLPVGCLMRSPNGTFPEYHTSADDLAFVRDDAMADSVRTLLRIVDLAEANGTWVNTCPYGEPQLGRRGLYAKIGGQTTPGGGPDYDQLTLLWVLNLGDGRHSLLDVAERSGKPFAAVAAAAAALSEAGLLRPVAAAASGAMASEAQPFPGASSWMTHS